MAEEFLDINGKRVEATHRQQLCDPSHPFCHLLLEVLHSSRPSSAYPMADQMNRQIGKGPQIHHRASKLPLALYPVILQHLWPSVP